MKAIILWNLKSEWENFFKRQNFTGPYMWLKAIKLLHSTNASVRLTKQNRVLISSESTRSCQYKSWDRPQTHPLRFLHVLIICRGFYAWVLPSILLSPSTPHDPSTRSLQYTSVSIGISSTPPSLPSWGPLHALLLIHQLFSCNVIILYEVTWVQLVLLL